MSGNNGRRRCGATTRRGTPCRNWAVEDGRCRLHVRRRSGASGDDPDTTSGASGQDPGRSRAGRGGAGPGRQAPTLTTFTAGATGRRARRGSDDNGSDPAADGRPAGGASGSSSGGSGRYDRTFSRAAGASADAGRRDPTDVVDALADVLGADLAGHLEGIGAFLRRRVAGDYDVDEFGLDPDLLRHVLHPLLAPLYDTWWRVTSDGREHVPPEGGALLVANHAGTLPFDGLMLGYDVHDATGRFLRELGADLVFQTPFVGHLARKGGTVRAAPADVDRVLARGELAGVFPEGFKGLGKPFGQRYQLQRFGRGGFVATALRARVPIVPVAIVGSEEIYPMLFDAKVVARALGLPYFPIVAQVLALPFVGPAGLLPLPSKWSITYGEPIATDHLPEGAADDPMVVFDLADRVRDTIQEMLTRQLMGRRSVFF